jgi:hypothetical protein
VIAELKIRGNLMLFRQLWMKLLIQGAAEITPTFQMGITNKWYEISPKTFYFLNVDINKFLTLGFKNYIVQMVAVTADTHLEPFFLNGLL